MAQAAQRARPDAAAPPGKVLDIHGLDARYGEALALEGINLDVREGEILVIMGHSGSGKSTLFRTILGLMRPSAGDIEVLGRDLNRIGRKGLYDLRRQIGVAFQGGALFSSLTVRENVELPLREHTRLDDSTIRIMARMKLALMDLAGCEDQMPAQLSGGMLKRAGLARAVIMDPKLLFFDEPSAGLDPVTSAGLDALILKLRDALHMSIVIITHELESAFNIADRITILDSGRQLITGTPEEIRACEDPRVSNMLNRMAASRAPDGEEYLRHLTE